ncbi:tail fiber domain-containing protein [Bradyrhizobium sp. USDA 3458]|uniref:tail fiber domain-containing protein n=1 Tax=Bradyrhizobium sp. USDA 3458 TaxID=2591461 RepID=UPI0011428599|nr:tail fiber domain-containing protein [Bradyrhizobium sp. USDA 3458]
MAFNGSGTFVRLFSWQDDRNNGIKIVADRHDQEDDGIATGLSNTICKDGQSTTTALIPFAAGIGLNDGTTSAPAISFNSDPNTGIYRIGADTLGIALGGSAAVRFAATAISPAADDGQALGTTSFKFSDLFLASGGVINFNSGNFTLTHTAGNLTASGIFNAASFVAVGNVSGDVAQFNNYNVPNGSASTPTLRAQLDSDTGIFFPGANLLGFSAGGIEYARVSGSGYLLVGKTTVNTGDAGTMIQATGAGRWNVTRDNTAGTQTTVAFYDFNGGAAGTIVGSISTTDTATAYNVSSDQRIKTDFQDVTDVGSLIDGIQPKSFLFIGKEEFGRTVGFVAQELMQVVPAAVTVGSAEGVSADDPEFVPHQINMMALMPYAMAELKSLRARVAALENHP